MPRYEVLWAKNTLWGVHVEASSRDEALDMIERQLDAGDYVDGRVSVNCNTEIVSIAKVEDDK